MMETSSELHYTCSARYEMVTGFDMATTAKMKTISTVESLKA